MDPSKPEGDASSQMGKKRSSDPHSHTNFVMREAPFANVPAAITLPPPSTSARTSYSDSGSPDTKARHSSTSSIDSGYATGLFTLDRFDFPNTSIQHPLPSVPTQSLKQKIPRTQPSPVQQHPLPPPFNNQKRPACIPCRRKKVGCDLRQIGSDYDPPCLRCRHENQRCFFANSENIPHNPSPQELPSIRDLACQHCSSVFLHDQDLKAHLRTQCQEKHYVCKHCQARFRRLNDLDRHVRIHTGERPHTCDVCGRKFSRATTLTRHKQGPNGCAGRRADLGRRRIGSVVSASESNPSTPTDLPSSAGSIPQWSPTTPELGLASQYPIMENSPPISHRYSDGLVQSPGTRQFKPPLRRYSTNDMAATYTPQVPQRPTELHRYASDMSQPANGAMLPPPPTSIITHNQG